MNIRAKLAAGIAVLGIAAIGGPAAATGDHSGNGGGGDTDFSARLTGYEEVPAISTSARGTFRASLTNGGLRWELRYSGIEGGSVLQAHIHFGQRKVNGGVSAFLCSNLAGAPAGTQACPQDSATLRGTVTAEDVVGPAEQGIAPGELDELVRAMRAGLTYANVHSEAFPNGEIRGQIWP